MRCYDIMLCEMVIGNAPLGNELIYRPNQNEATPSKMFQCIDEKSIIGELCEVLDP